MKLYLNPQINPLMRLYEVFEVPGAETEDNPNYLGVSIPINWAQPGSARELVRFLSELPSGVIKVLGLRFDARQLADFTAESARTWFEWETIRELINVGKLCELCAEHFKSLHSRMQEHEVGAHWVNVVDDSHAIIDQLETCTTCSPHLKLDAAVDKTSSANQFLIGGLLKSGRNISALVWYDQVHLHAAFASFQEFLEFVGERASAPLVLFFYQPVEPYQGDYFQIMSLSPAGVEVSAKEDEVQQKLNRYTTDVLTRYQMLYTNYRDERRTDLGERLNIPPTLFLYESDKLASYPSHPIFMSGPLRSLLVYSMMAWVAAKTEEEGGVVTFTLSPDEADPLIAFFSFSLTDVRQGDQSIFINENWSEIAGRVARDIEQSAGSEYFRDCWAEAMEDLTRDEFTPDKFFDTLEIIRRKADEKRREPAADIRRLTPDLSLYIHLDTVNKRLLFQLGYHDPSLGLKFEPGSLQSPLPEVSIAELDAMARRNMTAILDKDPKNSAVKIPILENLETRGEALWDHMIPTELKHAFISLPNRDLTLFIFSEDRSFPWELIKPRELAGSKIIAAGFKGDWWALRFGIARWAPGAPPPANEIGITNVCCVAASSALFSAEEEIDYFKSLNAHGVTVDLPMTRDELIEFLNTRKYDVVHFACHGQFKVEDPGESAIQLPDGEILRPDDLRRGNIPQKIRDTRPLIFLNCCHSGRTGSTLVGIAGWAQRLVDWGCGAFIGCGWEVADPLAAEFAITFYTNFRNHKKTLGQAVHQARKQIRKRSIEQGRPQNSTWLAYYLYGNPNCRHKGVAINVLGRAGER